MLILWLVRVLLRSAIARWYARFQLKAAKVMGRKKKMRRRRTLPPLEILAERLERPLGTPKMAYLGIYLVYI